MSVSGGVGLFGDFLNGYLRARQQKHEASLAEQQTKMNTAMKWAEIADSTKDDAIREMATRNMQDLIVQHEKEAGEKHGLGAILKLFRKDGKDTPSMLNELAPMLSQKVEPMQAEIPKTLDAGGESRESTEAQAPAAPAAPAATAAPAAPATLTPPPQNGAAMRFQEIANNLAPGRSVFIPRADGRFSETNAEKDQRALDLMKRENEIRSGQEFENQKKLTDYNRQLKEQDEKKALTELEKNPGYINADPTTQGFMRSAAVGRTIAIPPEQFYRPVGPEEFDDKTGRVSKKNAFGVPIDVTSEYRKDNQLAASYYDGMATGTRNWDEAKRKAAQYQRSVEGLQKKLHEAQIFEANSSGSYRNAMSSLERTKQENTTRVLQRETADRVQKRLKELDYAWLQKDQGALATLTSQAKKAHRANPAIPQDVDGYIKTMKKADGTPYKDLDDFKKDWYENQLGGVSLERAENMAITGNDPMAKFFPVDNEVVGGVSGTTTSSNRSPLMKSPQQAAADLDSKLFGTTN